MDLNEHFTNRQMSLIFRAVLYYVGSRPVAEGSKEWHVLLEKLAEVNSAIEMADTLSEIMPHLFLSDEYLDKQIEMFKQAE